MSSTHRIQHHRNRAYDQQDGRCFYCGVRMWRASPDELHAQARSAAALAKLRCTAEHLLAQCDGGTHTAANIVAACSRCNQGRHQLHRPPEPLAYRKHVARLVAQRCWHQRWVYEVGLVTARRP